MLESPVEYALIRTMMQQFKFLCPYMVTTDRCQQQFTGDDFLRHVQTSLLGRDKPSS